VLCVDKTGTLTENRMALRLLRREGASHDFTRDGGLPEPLRELLDAAVRASRPLAADLIEQALQAAAAQAGTESAPPGPQPRLEREYGLSASRPALVRIWTQAGGAHAFAKGAPETVIGLCDDAGKETALLAAAALAREGLRVLAVAEAAGVAPPWPNDPAALRYRLRGLVAFADPLRADIPEAVSQCRQAGVRVLMITGDHPGTAQAVAGQAGLAPGKTLTGPEIADMPAHTLAARLEGVSVCARIVPGQKLAIVRALQEGGAVVAMTGDGVNDAPALRAGRRIFSNMRKSMRYVAAIHVPITVLALLPPLFGWPAVLYPMHIVFLELVIGPACSLAFESEAEEADLMRRPPRRPDEPLLGRETLLAALLCGLWAAALLVVCYALAVSRLSAAEARATTFAALILCNLGLLLAHRQHDSIADALRVPNPVFLAICAGALGVLAAALYLPGLAEIFLFKPPPPAWLARAAAAPVLMLLGLQAARRR
jgi:Ca2+-transporting ATPase